MCHPLIPRSSGMIECEASESGPVFFETGWNNSGLGANVPVHRVPRARRLVSTDRRVRRCLPDPAHGQLYAGCGGSQNTGVE